MMTGAPSLKNFSMRYDTFLQSWQIQMDKSLLKTIWIFKTVGFHASKFSTLEEAILIKFSATKKHSYKKQTDVCKARKIIYFVNAYAGSTSQFWLNKK